jgi:hypothetical protein
MPECRNWQTNRTQNPAHFTGRVGSSPTSGTTFFLRNYKDYPVCVLNTYQLGHYYGLRFTRQSATSSEYAVFRTHPFHVLHGGLNLVWPVVDMLDAGLYRRASSRQPSGGSIGAIVGSCIEGNRCAWGGLMNSIDHRFK